MARIRLERLTAPPFSTPIYLVFCNFLRPHPGKHARNSRSCPRTGAAEGFCGPVYFTGGRDRDDDRGADAC